MQTCWITEWEDNGSGGVRSHLADYLFSKGTGFGGRAD